MSVLLKHKIHGRHLVMTEGEAEEHITKHGWERMDGSEVAPVPAKAVVESEPEPAKAVVESEPEPAKADSGAKVDSSHNWLGQPSKKSAPKRPGRSRKGE